MNVNKLYKEIDLNASNLVSANSRDDRDCLLNKGKELSYLDLTLGQWITYCPNTSLFRDKNLLIGETWRAL